MDAIQKLEESDSLTVLNVFLGWLLIQAIRSTTTIPSPQRRNAAMAVSCVVAMEQVELR
jgi:hypothetical protein